MGNKINTEEIIEKVESNLRKYLAMKPEVFPLIIFDGKARLHRISDNLVRIEVRPECDWEIKTKR